MELTPQRALVESKVLILQAYRDLRIGEAESAASKVSRAIAFVEYAHDDEDGKWQGRLRVQRYWRST